MPIPITCEYCEVSYRIADRAAGKTVRCKDCGEAIDVPGAATRETGRRPSRSSASRTSATRASRPPRPTRPTGQQRSRPASASKNWVAIAIGGVIGGLILVAGIAALVMLSDSDEPPIANATAVGRPYQAPRYGTPNPSRDALEQSQRRIDQMQADMKRRSEESHRRMQQEMDRMAQEARRATQPPGGSNFGSPPNLPGSRFRPPSRQPGSRFGRQQ